MNTQVPVNPISSSEDAFQLEREAYERLLKSHEQFRKALCVIAYSSHSIYQDNSSDYQIGVADGHRCAANTAMKVLKENDLV